MNYVKSMILVVASVLLPLVACAPGEAPGPAATPALEKKASTTEGWEAAWDRTLRQARDEGKVVVYSTYPAEARTAIAQAFKAKYGMDAEFVTGRGAELRTRLERERIAGIYAGDFFLKGIGGEDFGFVKAGMVDRMKPLLILPEALDARAWLGGKLPWVDDAGEYFLGFMAYPSGQIYINTSAVNPDEIKSWRDFLAPRWKGKIMIGDPTVSGAANIWFSIVGNHIMGFDYMRGLVNQEPVILRDQRLLTEWLAFGKYPVLVGVSPDVVAEFVRAGAPIKYKIVQEGGWVAVGSGGISHINRAPHPAAARVFVNWLLTKEGQTVFSRASRLHSARVDVPTDHLSPQETRQEGIKYFDARTEQIQMEQLEAAKTAREIFGPLLK